MLRRLFNTSFLSRSSCPGNDLPVLLAQAVGRSQLSSDDAHLPCANCGYDLHGLSGDARCPECAHPVFSTTIQLARRLTENVEGDPADHPSRRPLKFVQETLGYPIDAFIFVLDAVQIAAEQNKKREQPSSTVTAEMLCDVVRRFAVKYFGMEREARAVFLDWNIRSSDDIGRIVWAMIRGGVLHADSGDALEQFAGLFDVEQWHAE
jgi:uncharacterized repeat protein (TIGR04138 family)